MTRICGIDEAGRGPLAGAVYAAAVILNPDSPILGLADSKKLSEAKRDGLAAQIKSNALAWGIASVSAQEIDAINILQASLLAMQRAYQDMIRQFGIVATLIQVDGNRCPKFDIPVKLSLKAIAKWLKYPQRLSLPKPQEMHPYMLWTRNIRNMALRNTKAILPHCI